MPTIRKHLAIALGAFALPFGGALQQCTPSYVEPHRVTIVGDSISVDTRDEFQQAIDDVHVNAIWGRGWDSNAGGQTFPTFRQAILAEVPNIEAGGWLIIQDDGGEGPTSPEIVAWVLSAVPDNVNIGWVSPSNNERSWTADSQANIRAADVTYIDWHSVALANPQLLTDGLHLNQDGQWALTHVVWSVTS